MILIILLSILLILSYLLNKSPLSASNILVFSFLVSSICAYEISFDVNYYISIKTIFIIVLFNFIFILFNYFFSKDVLFDSEKNINYENANLYPDFIDVARYKIILSFVFQILTISLVVFYFKSEFGNLNSSTLSEFRSLTLYGKDRKSVV